MEIIMSETTGQKLTNNSEVDTMNTSTIPNVKNSIFESGKWWYVGASDGARRSIEAHRRKNSNRMFVGGKYVPASHPLHTPGRFKTFESVAFASLDKYSTVAYGYVYIISNPAWEGWFKVGRAIDAYDRCSGYQTSSPLRDYAVEYCKYFDNRKNAEEKVHEQLANNKIEKRGEWFKASLKDIKSIVQNTEL